MIRIAMLFVFAGMAAGNSVYMMESTTIVDPNKPLIDTYFLWQYDVGAKNLTKVTTGGRGLPRDADPPPAVGPTRKRPFAPWSSMTLSLHGQSAHHRLTHFPRPRPTLPAVRSASP